MITKGKWSNKSRQKNRRGNIRGMKFRKPNEVSNETQALKSNNDGNRGPKFKFGKVFYLFGAKG